MGIFIYVISTENHKRDSLNRIAASTRKHQLVSLVVPWKTSKGCLLKVILKSPQISTHKNLLSKEDLKRYFIHRKCLKSLLLPKDFKRKRISRKTSEDNLSIKYLKKFLSIKVFRRQKKISSTPQKISIKQISTCFPQVDGLKRYFVHKNLKGRQSRSHKKLNIQWTSVGSSYQ